MATEIRLKAMIKQLEGEKKTQKFYIKQLNEEKSDLLK
jgi:hypothetical protein